MSDERVIEYLRFRGQAQPPTDLVPRIMAAVDTAPVSRSPFAAFLPAAVAIGVVAVVVTIVALILGQEPERRSRADRVDRGAAVAGQRRGAARRARVRDRGAS